MQSSRWSSDKVIIIAFAMMHLVVDAQVPLPLEADLNAIIAGHPPGTTFMLEAGVHRGQELQLREGDTLIGEEGAKLSGAELLAGWRFEDPFWVHDGPHAKVVVDYDESARPWELRARWPHDLFIDNVPIVQKYASILVKDEKSWAYDYEADKIYVRFNPEGHIMELSGLCRYGLRTRASGVNVRNVHFDKFATTGQSGAVELGSHSTIENCIVSGSHATGMRISSNTQVRQCRFSWNGLAGLHNGGDGSLVEYCEFDHNGWAGFSGNWSRGGMKMPSVSNMVIRRNYAHHNIGPGFWFDINAHNNLFEENLSEYNSWEGLLFELSCDCEIRNNIMRWNGLEPRGGLLWGVPFVIQNAEKANVHHNYFEAAPHDDARAGGVSIINQNRPQHTDGVCGDHVTENNHIHHNVMVMPRGGYNGLQYGSFGWDGYKDFLDAGNLWEQNTYLTGQPVSGNFHWYEQGETESDFISSYHTWSEWLSLGQDSGSHFIGRHRAFFNVANPQLDELIKTTTGVSYAELKAPFVKPPFDPEMDNDGDGMPDGWELFYGLDPSLSDASGDMDSDGLSNIEEYRGATNPVEQDTDDDGLPDQWEVVNGLSPIAANALGDPDEDGLVNMEEFESDLSPRTADLLTGIFPSAGLSMWLKSGAALRVNDSWRVGIWPDWRDGVDTNMYTSNPLNGPSISKTLANGYPLLNFGPSNLKAAGEDIFGQHSDGWTLMVVLRPEHVEGASEVYAILGNSIWRESGFRLTLEQGYLHFYSTQPTSPLSLRSFQRLEEGSTSVVTLMYDGLKGEGRLYIDGEEQGRSTGRVPPNQASLKVGRIGGMTSQSVSIAELITFSRPLTHLHRREVEAMLRGKYQSIGLAMADSDGDGMKDWWEIEYGDLHDPQADSDNDGLNNITEFWNRTNPTSNDTDGDGLSDFWEVDNGWNPRFDDSVIDADNDGLSTVNEQMAGTSPENPDSDGDGFDDGEELALGTNPNDEQSRPNRPPIFTDRSLSISRSTAQNTAIDIFPSNDTNGDLVSYEIVNNLDVDKDGDTAFRIEGNQLVVNDYGDLNDLALKVPVAAGGYHSLALGFDGRVTGWGRDNDGQAFVPKGMNSPITAAAGLYHSLVLQEDGVVVAWGANDFAQSVVPENLTMVKAISAGGYHNLALQTDGRVVAWGRNNYGQSNVPSDLGSASAIAAGAWHSMALLESGQVVAWGINNWGQRSVPSGLNQVVSISAGALHSLALKADGRLVAWGQNTYRQRSVPANLEKVVAIAAGGYHNLALRENGNVVAWGRNDYGQASVPEGLTGVIAIFAGGHHSMALKSDGTLVGWGRRGDGQLDIPQDLRINQKLLHRVDMLQIEVQASDGENFTDAIVTIDLLNDQGEDLDGDGLPYSEEIIAGTDPLFADTDRDGMHDGWELFYHFDPLTDESSEDDDFDGFDNIDELAAGTNPVEWLDTDNDGMHDRWELQSGLKVGTADGKQDNDGDLQSNFMEFIFGGNPQDVDSVYRLGTRLENFEFPIIEFHRSRAVSRHYYKIYIEKLNTDDTWDPLPESALTSYYIGEGIEKVVLRPAFGEKGYYRVKVSPRL